MAGHEVFISAMYGLRGQRIRSGGLEILPGSYDEYGNDILAPHYNALRPDVTVLLFDIWVYNPDVLREVPVTSWCPIDHEPMPPQVLQKLALCRHAWAMSRHGEREMRKHGVDPFYVPHGVDTTVYTPADRQQCKEQIGLEKYDFVALTVAANKGWPSRKNLDVMFKAWGRFVQTHPKALLYVHSNVLPVHDGADLVQMARFYGIGPENIKFASVYKMLMGDYTPASMNKLYNAADVFLLPSAGEGFGIPVVEAQAAGCPVIVSDFSAQSELGEAGYRIPVDPFDGTHYTLGGSEQATILPSQVLRALEWAYEKRGDAKLRGEAREFALPYDARRVWSRHMEPALQCIAQMDADLMFAPSA